MGTPLTVTEHPALEWHRLELRFATTRLAPRGALAALERSLAQAGQLRPLVAVPTPEPATPSRFVLIDGYRRRAALHRLGHDSAWVQVWDCGIAQALVALLAHTHSRPFEPLEQALLLQELARAGGLSQHALARALGRDVSWVNRRLALLTALSEPLLAAVLAGTVSTWAAARVLAPLARANPDHAQTLLAALHAAPLATRDLARWWAHYQGASSAVRARLIAAPALFVQADQAARDQQQAQALAAGPEGAWIADCTRAERLLAGLRQRLGALAAPLAPELAAGGPELHTAFARLTRAFTALAHDFHRYRPDDPDPDPRPGLPPRRAGHPAARDQPPAAPVTQHGPPPPADPTASDTGSARAPR